MAASVNFDEVDDTPLEEDDLPEVLLAVESLRNRADDLGIALKLSPSFCVKGVELKAVLHKWLKQEGKDIPSWRSLVKAVKNPVGGENPALAKKIARQHLQKKLAAPIPVSTAVPATGYEEPPQQKQPYSLSTNVSTPHEEVQGGSTETKLVCLRQPSGSLTPSVATGASLSSIGSQESQQLSRASTDSRPSQVSSSSSSGFQDTSFGASSHSRPNMHPAHPFSRAEDETSNAPSVQGEVDSGDEELEEDVDGGTRHTESDSFTSIITSFKQHLWKRKQVSIEEFMSAYKVNPHTSHGCAIIINIARVPRYKERKGSEKDQENLKKLFKELRYDVVVKSELNKEGFKTLSEQVQAANYKDSDSFVCCFLSHGEIIKGEEVIFLADGTGLTMNDVKKMAVENKTLVGKPKLFFVQACRGSEMKGARNIRTDGLEKEPKMFVATKDYFHPYYSDVFVGYATTTGTKACRDPQDWTEGDLKGQAGSWYINELCFVLATLYKTHDLLSMMNIIHNILARDERYVKEVGDEKYRQAGQLESTLIRPFFFEAKETVAPSSSDS